MNDWSAIKALAKKDMREYLRWPLFYLVVIGFPAAAVIYRYIFYALVFKDTMYGSSGVPIHLQSADIGYRQVLNSFYLLFFIASTLGFCAFFNEKHNRSLEQLLASPVSDRALMVGKMIPPFSMALAVGYVGLCERIIRWCAVWKFYDFERIFEWGQVAFLVLELPAIAFFIAMGMMFISLNACSQLKCILGFFLFAGACSLIFVSFMLSAFYSEAISFRASAWIMTAVTYALDIIAWLLTPKFFNRLLIAERSRF